MFNNNKVITKEYLLELVKFYTENINNLISESIHTNNVDVREYLHKEITRNKKELDHVRYDLAKFELNKVRKVLKNSNGYVIL